jgi:hypothetical protein
MWPYWVLFLLPATGAVFSRAETGASLRSVPQPRVHRLAWTLVAVFIFLMVGYRDEVGGDWFNYLRALAELSDLTLPQILLRSDPGYGAVNWVMMQLGWGIVGVNITCSLLFTIGLAVFCRSMPRPWLALAVAVPYLVIVVGMGYSRQAVALGFGMLGLVALGRQSNVRFVFWVLVAASFHRSAILLLPVSALASSRDRFWTLAWVGVVAVTVFLLLLANDFEQLYANYVDSPVQSEGAGVRLLMNAVPSLVLLGFRRRFRFAASERRLWWWFAVISIALLLALPFTAASTSLDRIGLYMLPLQLAVFSRLPSVLGRSGAAVRAWTTTVVVCYALVEFVWLNFATHAVYWIPYKFVPLERVF